METAMPALETASVLDWLTACEPATARAPITPIRPIEEGDDSRDGLAALGAALDRFDGAQRTLSACLASGEPGQDLRALLIQLGAARLLRLLRWLSTEAGPDGERVLMALLDGTYGTADPIRATLQALHRQALLARIFDEARLRILLVAAKDAQQEAPT
jgi:hypothetical protein